MILYAFLIFMIIILPTMLAVAAMIGSVSMAYRARHILHIAASVIVLAGASWSLWGLYRMFMFRGWPTYLPHIVIGIVLVIVVM